MSAPSPADRYDANESIYLLVEFGNERVRKIIDENPNLSPFKTARLVIKAFEEWKATRLPVLSDDGFDFDAVDFEDEDDDMDDSEDEDEDGGEIGKLGGESKPGTVKRPQSPMEEGELECKKPRIAQGSATACQGEERESGGKKDSSQPVGSDDDMLM